MKQNNCSVQQTELVKPVNQIGLNRLKQFAQNLQVTPTQNEPKYQCIWSYDAGFTNSFSASVPPTVTERLNEGKCKFLWCLSVYVTRWADEELMFIHFICFRHVKHPRFTSLFCAFIIKLGIRYVTAWLCKGTWIEPVHWNELSERTSSRERIRFPEALDYR